MALGTNEYVDIYERLIRHLEIHNEIVAVSAIFARLETNEKRVSFAYDLLRENALLPNLLVDGKSSKTSEEFRLQGNEMFKNGLKKAAHELYTKSIAHAENGSENLGLAFANRSAVLFEYELYQECLQDIKEALKNNYPEKLKHKVLTRQFKAKQLLPTQTPIEFYTPIPTLPEEHKNPLIQSASDCVKIVNSNEVGRHIVTTRNIDPGEILAIDKPCYQVLIEQFFIHCHHCLKLCYTLIPCRNCTQTFYCGMECLKQAMAYHLYECPILLTVKTMEMDKLKLLPMQIAILVRDKYDSLDECVLDKDGVYRSDRYEEIHNLVANTEKRSVSDLFSRSIHAAIIFHLIKNHTSFFEGEEERYQSIFKELVLFHMQTGACNFHEITEIKSSDQSLEQKEIGAGAYSFLSMFNHSCSPNIVRYSYGSTTIIISLESINEGQQCFDNYGYHHAVMPLEQRQARLKKQYFFDCTCTACISDFPMFDALPTLKNSNEVIPPEELEVLCNNNLEEAKKIVVRTVERIKRFEHVKPNGNLAELQEVLKQCHFIFRTIRTPV